MMYVDPSSQYKYVARSTPNVPPSEATSTNITSDTATVSTAENIAPITVQAPTNTATHFQAQEHVQKQAALAQNAGITTVPSSPGQAAPPAGQAAPGQASGVAGAPGQGLTYDGKRMRKTMQRRTVDYNSSVIRFLEARKWFKSSRNQHALQPQEIYNVDVVPPCGYIKNPMNAVTTKFVRTSTNKLRCPIFCVVWTPEGRRLVTGASSGEFTLWNGLTFNFETILQAHDRAVRSMVWSHNDQWLLTGDHGGFVKYWQSNMNNVKMYEAHKEPVRGLSVFTGYYDLCKYSDENWIGKLIGSVPFTSVKGDVVVGQKSSPTSLYIVFLVTLHSFSPSDNKFASCSDDGLVKVWDFYRCAEERELKGHGADVKCVDWHPSKGLLVSGSKDSQQPVKLWDPKSGNSITTLHCHKSTVMAAKWNSNGNWLVTGSRDHLLKLFDIRMMKELQTFRGHKKEATVVAWHPVHETLFASGGSDGSLMFWLTGVDEKAGGMEKAHEGIVWSLSWHPVGHILCSGSNDHTSKFWARNRPGDAMSDKYNLDTQGSQEDGEYNEEGTSQTSVPALAAYDASQVIPGVGLPVTASNIVLPDSKDVDAHLYGESSKGKDNRKAAVSKPSTNTSSQFPYPPAFKQSAQYSFENRPGGLFQGIPGLDMSNTDIQMKHNNEGYKIPHLSGPPKLRLPTHLPTARPSPLNHPSSGNPPFLANHPGNRPPFGAGPRHRFDYRGPPGPNGPDQNPGPSGPFQSNQHMRFPGAHGPVGPRGGFEPHRGPDNSHVDPWAAPQHHGPRGNPLETYRPQHAPHGGPRPQNMPPDLYGQIGPRPHGVPVSPHARPDGHHQDPKSQDIPTSQHERRDSIEGGPRPRGPKIDDGQVRGQRPPPNMHSGQHGPREGLQEVQGLRRPPNDHNLRSDNVAPRDLQDGSHSGPAGQHETPHSGPKLKDVPPIHHGSRDGPNIRPDGLHGGPRPLPNANPHGSRGDGSYGPRPGSTDIRPNTPHGGPRPHDIPFGQRGPRDGSQGPRGPPGSPDTHASGPYGGPRLPLNIPPSQHGSRAGQRGQRAAPPSPLDGPNFGPRTVNDNSNSFGPRGARPPHFQPPRSDHPKPELKSPEGEKRGAPEPRENVARRSRDSPPRDSPPVSASNHVKQERRTSDSDTPGILGDYVTHVQEMQRARLENIASSAVGRLFGTPKPDIPRTDRLSHGPERPHADAGRPIARAGDRDRPDGERRGDRPPYKSSDRPDMAHPGDRSTRDNRDRDRPEIGRREDRSSHERSDMSRARDRSSFEGRPGDRPPRGSSQERPDKGQPGGRPPFERKDSGRQSERSFTDEEDLPAHEKPGLLPIPDMFLGRGLPSHDGPSRDQGSANHRPPDRRREHGRFQDGRSDKRPDNAGFGRGPRDPNPPEIGQENTRSGETNIKPLMSLLDASAINLGSPPGQGGVENRGRKRSMEHEFDRPPKRMGTGDNRERQR